MLHRHVKGLKVLAAASLLLGASASAVTSATVPFIGSGSGTLTLLSDGDVVGVSYGGGITQMGNTEIAFHFFGPSYEHGIIGIRIHRGSLHNDYSQDEAVEADLVGTVDTSSGLVTYSGVGTFTSGTGEFEGITGTFTYSVIQSGAFEYLGDSKPFDFSFAGTMTIPRGP